MRDSKNEPKSVSHYRESLRERILNTAMHAFTTHGIKAVKMDDIARELGISKRTLYETYENKEDLLYAGVKQLKEQKEHDMHELLAKSKNVMDIVLLSYQKKVEESRHVSPLFYSEIEKYPSVVAYLEEDKRENRQLITDFIKRGINEGFFRRDINVGLLTSTFEAIVNYYMSKQLYTYYSVEELSKNIIFISIRGICTQKGVEALDNFFAILPSNR